MPNLLVAACAVILFCASASSQTPSTAAAGRYAPDALLADPSSDTRKPIRTASEWTERRQQVLAAMQQVMGPLPAASDAPLDMKVLAEERGRNFLRQTIQYTSEVNPRTGKAERVPAYLFVPTDLKPGEKRPALLALHPTSKLGKAEIAGAGKPNRQYGLELAERGYVVICPDYPSFGDYAKDFAASAHPSGTMQGIVNHRRAVDLLVSLPQVDGDRIGAIGHSLGGHNALFIAAFDPRIKAAVTSCGWNLFQHYYNGNLTGWSSDRYMPRIKSVYETSPDKMPFDFHEVIAAIAPRAVLSISPTQDSNFAVEGIRQAMPSIRAVYTLLGAEKAIAVEYPECGHDFPPEMRTRAYTFLDGVLKAPSAKPEPAKMPAEPQSATESDAARWLAAAGKTPELAIAATVEQWEAQRARIREQLWKLLGDLPPRPQPPVVKTIAREDRGDYLLEKFTFDNGAGATVPGYVLLPKGVTGKGPAILYCHWHGGQYDIGKEELFGTNATPVPAGPALARAGYVVVAIDAYGFGERNGRGPGGRAEKGGAAEMTAAKFNLWVGRTLWGMIVRDDLIALDYLCSRPEVDASRVAVTGISMGATRTWWITALDDRPKTGIAVACLTRYQELITTEQLRAHGIYYFVPGMLKHFDAEAVVALSAPRPMLFMTGGKDAGSPADGIGRIEAAVARVYALYGPEAAGRFRNIVYPDLGHVYTAQMWAQTTDWLAEQLK